MPFNITQEFVQQLLEQIAQLTKQVSELTAEISELQQTIKELEEKKRKVGVLGKWAPCGFCAELRAESTGKPGLYTLQAALPCHMG